MVRSVGGSSEIDAPLEKVWAVLTDVDSYPAWNPFTVSVKTDFQLGSPVDMQVCLKGRRKRDGSRRTMHQVEYVTSYVEGSRVSWGVNVGPGWFVKADRWQQLTDLGGGRTRYETVDEFTGVGVGFMMLLMEKHMQRGFQEVADALKSRCEAT
ncbi:MAG: hypothetical protein JWO22_3192 [Frankiales bacterium]|nr:hypothetical protein [Frankiales bacterium]